jgi:hypothetical protein
MAGWHWLLLAAGVQPLLSGERLVRRDGVSALQMSATLEEAMGNAPLYMVNFGFDIKTFNPAGGISIVFEKSKYSLQAEAGLGDPRALAWGHFDDHIQKNGWSELYLQTSKSARSTNDVRMYAAGFAEGLMTATRLSQFYSNFYQLINMNEDNAAALANIKHMYAQELEFVRTNANLHPGALSVEPMDPYWKHARYMLFQLWGMKDGYNAAALAHGVRFLDLIDFWMINSHGELSEEMQAYTPAAIKERREKQRPGAIKAQLMQIKQIMKTARDPAWLAKSGDKDWEMRMRKSRCSGLVRLTEQNADLLVGHTTWDDYAKMTRIFKYYDFSLGGAFTKTGHMAFSSYPGCLSSTDNFYLLDGGLAIVDTSLEILNPEVYDRVPDFPGNPKIPLFLHVMVCNRMAATANHWTSLFAERNAGTGNAQWIVVDYNQFAPGAPLPDNTVWLVEQIPGMTRKMDISNTLRMKGYFASYNRPFFSDIRAVTGHDAAAAAHGPLYSYDGAPRASIFARVGPAVGTLFDMRNLMTRNTWPNEGTAPSAPGHAVAARMDLVAYSPIPNGAIDAKVVNRCLFRSLQAQAYSSPSHSTQKPFAWRDPSGKDLWPGWPHLGLPDLWEFDWVQMTPTGALPKLSDVSSC